MGVGDDRLELSGQAEEGQTKRTPTSDINEIAEQPSRWVRFVPPQFAPPQFLQQRYGCQQVYLVALKIES